jgi:hypothetical protein
MEVLRALPHPDSAARRLQVCVLEDLVSEGHGNAADSLVEALEARGLDTWSPAQAYVVGYWRLRQSGAAFSDVPDTVAGRWLANAFSRVRDTATVSRYLELRRLCLDTWTARPCWTTLQNLALSAPRRFWLPMLALHDLLSQRLTSHDVRDVGELLKFAERNLATLEPAERVRLRNWLILDRVRWLTWASRHGDSPGGTGPAFADLEQLFREIQSGSVRAPSAEDVQDALYAGYLERGNPRAAEAALGDTTSASLETLNERRVFLHLVWGRVDSARVMAQDGLDRDPSSPDAQFRAALTNLVDRTSRADSLTRIFLDSDHGYHDYARMLWYWALASQGHADGAADMISRRWAEIDRTKWPRRIQRGDPKVWREMLMGYYAGALTRADIFGPLASDSAFQRSAWPQMGYPLQGMRCEAHFYEGLLYAVSGPSATRTQRALASFEKSIATNHRLYYEYYLAQIFKARYEKTRDRVGRGGA